MQDLKENKVYQTPKSISRWDRRFHLSTNKYHLLNNFNNKTNSLAQLLLWTVVSILWLRIIKALKCSLKFKNISPTNKKPVVQVKERSHNSTLTNLISNSLQRLMGNNNTLRKARENPRDQYLTNTISLMSTENLIISKTLNPQIIQN